MYFWNPVKQNNISFEAAEKTQALEQYTHKCD